MAINIDSVYKTVLSILNKEQRGFITPSQFNKVAEQAQLELLEKNFYEYNRFLNRRNNNGYANIPEKIKEKIDVFYKISGDITASSSVADLPTDLYKLVDVRIGDVSVEQVDQYEFSYLNQSPLTKPSASFPVYYISSSTDAKADFSQAINKITLAGSSDSAVIKVHYIKKPAAPKWHYSVVNGAYTFLSNSQETQHFQLHSSEQADLIIRILSHVGVTLSDPTIVQAAAQQEANNVNQENA